MVEFETGQVIATAVSKGRTHDFKLLKRSRLPFVSSQLCLADQRLSRLCQAASGGLYSYEETPQAIFAQSRETT
ncbi:hypothetical protein [Leptolyngbya sp. NK1-12]|uniref:hypothetical protein n=1 Tax=Leptolyngbya sp. NK1-12 TaxID=2547451 RepID=UPI003B639E2D